MIEVEARHLQLIKTILKRRVPTLEIRAFGSRVSGNAKHYSDLDLVVMGNEKMPLSVLYGLRDDFEESDVPFRIDILDWHRISSDFQKIILSKSEPFIH